MSTSTSPPLIQPTTKLFSNAPSPGASLPPNIPISLLELCTFFPHATQRPDVIRRAVRSGWHSASLAKAQCAARSTPHTTLLAVEQRDDTIRQHIAETFRAIDSTATQWARSPHGQLPRAPFPSTGRWEDWYHVDGLGLPPKVIPTGPPSLLEVVGGVVEFPRGEDRGVLSMVVEWAMGQGEEFLRVKTVDDVERIADERGFVSPKGVHGPLWDVEGLARLALVTDV